MTYPDRATRRAGGIHRMRMFLADYGINSSDVLEDGASPDGYYVFVKDPIRGRVYDYEQDQFAREFREWPEGFDYEEFRTIYEMYYL